MKKIILLLVVGGAIIFTSHIPKNSFANDILTILGIDDKELFSNYLFCVTDPNCFIAPPKLTKLNELRILASGDKLKLVEKAFSYTKEYYNSQEFKKLYEEERMSLKPKTQQLSESLKKSQREQIAQLEEMYTPEILDMLPPEARKNALQELKNMKAVLEGQLTERQKQEWEDIAPENPNTAIKRALKEFLAATENVDFSAKTKLNPKYNHYEFTNPIFEKKDLQWKACYRAGKELTDATRNLAKKWLAELK